MNHNSGTNHVNGHNGDKNKQTEVCPTCGAKISREALDRILRLGEAREMELAEARAALEKEKEEINMHRAEIAENAAAAESQKWEATAQEMARETARYREKVATEQERAERAHKKQLQDTLAKMQAEVAKADAKAKAQIEKAKASAAAAAAAQAREAERTVKEKQRAEMDALRAELKTSEQRREREATAMKKTIVTLSRKADARDRAHFGPEGEEALIALLRDEFPGDQIERHGVRGDVVHNIVDRGKTVAKLVYECKNTSTFSASYVKQTREAMRHHNTSHGFLVTRTMPARHPGMCVVGDVMVVEPALCASIVSMVRDGVIAIARVNASEADKETKGATLVAYLRSDEFVGAMKRVAVKITELRDSLARERSSHDGWWRTREVAYTSILREVAGVDGRVADLLSGSPANDNGEKVEKVR